MAQKQKPKRDFSMRVFSIDSKFWTSDTGKSLPPDAKLLLFAICQLGGASGKVYASVETLGRIAFNVAIAASKRRVRPAIDALAAAGLVRNVNHKNGMPITFDLTERLTGIETDTASGICKPEPVSNQIGTGIETDTGSGIETDTVVSIKNINKEYAATASLCAGDAAQLAGGVDEYGKKKELPKTPVEDLPMFAREKYKMGLAAHAVH